jgi:hypothetical protein
MQSLVIAAGFHVILKTAFARSVKKEKKMSKIRELSITKCPEGPVAFTLVNNTKLNEVNENGTYIFRGFFDTRDDLHEVKNELIAAAESIKLKHPTSVYSFDMPGHSHGEEFILDVGEGGYEFRMILEIEAGRKENE